MTRTRTVATAAMMLFVLSGVGHAAKVGEPAPDFTGTDSHGKTVRLADLKGKFVVLEWHNDGCPYVGKHYGSGNMQRLQREWTGKGVVWLTVISSAPGEQGYVTADGPTRTQGEDRGADGGAARSQGHDRPPVRRARRRRTCS